MYAFSVEPIETVANYITKLCYEAAKEVDSVRSEEGINPDVESYIQAEDAGMCRLYTAREEVSERLIGFSLVMFQQSLQYKDKYIAVVDIIYIKPKHRGIGQKFLQLIEKDVKEEGVSYFSFSLPTGSKSSLPDKLGFKETETVYTKVL